MKNKKTAKAKKPKTTKSKKATHTSVTAANVRDAQKRNKLIERTGVNIWDASSIICTVFSVGRIPYAPGTWGALVGVVYFPLFLLIPIFVGAQTKELALVVLVALAILVLLYCIGVMAVNPAAVAG